MSLVDKDTFEICLIGNPNAGKTTLFNALTGLRAKVANYPGVTVDYQRGSLDLPTLGKLDIVDLPGIYSLSPHSEDELIALKGIKGELTGKSKRIVLLVADATHLDRQLYLLAQLKEHQVPTILVLTMMDSLKEEGMTLDIQSLQERIGIAICPIIARTKEGFDSLLHTIEELISQDSCCCVSSKTHCREANDVCDNAQEEARLIEHRYQQVEEWLDGIYFKNPPPKTLSDRIDAIALHPVWGIIVLLSIFAFIFEALFAWSEPFVAQIESLQNWINHGIEPLFVSTPLLGSLICDGVIAGVGSVLSFVPLIAMLFLFLGILEDSGYLARATFLLDRFFTKIGLPGRAFVPLLSGFACAVPAIMSTRVISSKKDRLLTILVTPLTSCSARLPVYGLLIAALFSNMPPFLGFIRIGSVVMLSMYLLGIVVAFIMAAFLKRFVIKGPVSPLLLELPDYRMPNIKGLASSVFSRVKTFVTEAGTVILALTIIMWALLTFPRTDISATQKMALSDEKIEAIQLENSYAGRIGHAIEPVIAPLGFDWKIGIGLLASFAAREVMVSTLGVVYGLGDNASENDLSLRQAMREDTHSDTGKAVYTPLVALSLMAFFALAMQCMSTLAVTKKETKSYKWPLFQFVYMTLIAWCVSCGIYQIGTFLGF